MSLPAAPSVPSPSAFRPLFNDFGPPSMGYVQVRPWGRGRRGEGGVGQR